MKDYDIKITAEIRIYPRVPYSSTAEEEKIKYMELKLQDRLDKFIKQVEDQMNKDFIDPHLLNPTTEK